MIKASACLGVSTLCEGVGPQPLKVLLIEDDVITRKVMRALFEGAGHTVRDAADGRKAVALLDQVTPDLVVTDIIMPEKDGFELIRDLRRTRPTVNIIAISGGGRVDAADYLKMATAFGAHRVLAKPFNGEELMALVSDLFPDV